MKSMRTHAVLPLLTIFMLAFSLLSCKKDDDPAPSSREVKYEITGTFTGTMALVYPAANGGNASEIITSLPWSKSITYDSSVKSIYFSFTGNGTNGQTATLKVYVGGQEKSSNSGTVTGGIVSISAPSYSF